MPKFETNLKRFGASLVNFDSSLLRDSLNSRYNPVELQAILIFGSDLEARCNSKLEDFAVLGATKHSSRRFLGHKSIR